MSQTFFQISVKIFKTQTILEKVDEHVRAKNNFFHIVSLNPEIIVSSRGNRVFLDVLQSANIHILDGIGVVLAARFLGISNPVHITGVDLMNELVVHGVDRRFRMMFLGGSEGLANRVCDCYHERYPQGVFRGVQGISDIKRSSNEREEKRLFQEIETFQPDILFVAFGSPWQELWLWQHRQKLSGIVCMGVGGGFDFVAGTVPRAPGIVRSIGLEWLFRLVQQPWRWKRQLRLVKFVWLVVQELGGKKSQSRRVSESHFYGE